MELIKKRVVKEREKIRAKVIEFDELNNLASISLKNVQDDKKDCYREQDLLKFEFKNVVSLMDKLDKIHHNIKMEKS